MDFEQQVAVAMHSTAEAVSPPVDVLVLGPYLVRRPLS